MGLACVGAALAAAGMAQTVLAYGAVRRFAAVRRPNAAVLPAITVLKPLHGAETMLEAALESFFTLDYPAFQLVFGIQSGADPARHTVEKLRARYPQVDVVLVCDPTPHGANRKIANLINMYPCAHHDVLVISDSDMHVAPDYLHRVAEALARPGTGLATSIYTGLPARGGFTAHMGAAYITQIFASGALLSRYLGRRDCLGATMALTRETLRRIGGFPALSPYVADDGILGRRVRALGLGVELALTAPATSVAEPHFIDLFRHELRWARTIRAMAPVGFILSAIQYPVFWALLAVAFSQGAIWALALLAAACLLRAASGRLMERSLGAAPTAPWLAPARDIMSIVVMAIAYLSHSVAWRGQVLTTAPDRALLASRDAFVSPPPVLAHGEGYSR
jgi:ceramide glucosyltransferase